MTTDSATTYRPCPECLAGDAEVRKIGPLDHRCPRCAAVGEWSMFSDFHQHYRDFDLDDANPDGWKAEINAAYEAAHVRIFGVECSEECGTGGHHIAARQVTRYRIPSETYAAMQLDLHRRLRGAPALSNVADDLPF